MTKKTATEPALMGMNHGPIGGRLLRRQEVEQITGKNKTSIYEDIKAGTFPAPVPIGSRCVAWLSEEIQEWIRARVAERDGRAKQRQRQVPGLQAAGR